MGVFSFTASSTGKPLVLEGKVVLLPGTMIVFVAKCVRGEPDWILTSIPSDPGMPEGPAGPGGP